MKDTTKQLPPEHDNQADDSGGVLLAEQDVLKILGGGSGRTLRRWIQDLDFPPPIRLTAQTRRWRESDIYRWIAQRASAQQTREAYRPAARRRATSQPTQAVTA
jgi:predicted DNA-binding transcriptional regulator AlpA